MILHIRQIIISLILTAIMTMLITLLIQKEGWQMWFMIPLGYTPVFFYMGICLDVQNKKNNIII